MTAVPSRIGSSRPLAVFMVLYALLYAAFGVASPFLPALIASRGIPPEQIGVLFAAGTAIRLASAPLAGLLADRTQALRLILSLCTVAAAAAAIGFLPDWGFWAIAVVSLLHAFTLAPTTNLADALALVASRQAHGFEYGWVRGAGSAAFILGSVVAGFAISSFGLPIVIILQAALMLAVPLAAWRVPPIGVTHRTVLSHAGASKLLREPVFRKVVLVAALVLGSHAMHDTFAVVRWTGAGISPHVAGALWSLSVAAEVVVFFLAGPWLLRLLGPAGAIALAAVAGAGRWLVAAVTADLGVLILTQPLHGLTFALLHLACMRLLADAVPAHLAATAQALYGTVGVGAATAVLTLISGWLYAALGPAAFGVMSVLCLLALPVAAGLRPRQEPVR